MRAPEGNGTCQYGENKPTGKLCPGQDIVVTRWIAMEAASLLAKERENELEKYLPADIVAAVQKMNVLDVTYEREIAAEEGAVLYPLRGTGIFDALWEFASMSSVGIETDLKKIPVRQEIIEICEILGLNPYLLPSGGALLLGTDHGSRLVSRLEREGIHSVVIGCATEGNDRIVRQGADRRFLVPARERLDQKF